MVAQAYILEDCTQVFHINPPCSIKDVDNSIEICLGVINEVIVDKVNAVIMPYGFEMKTEIGMKPFILKNNQIFVDINKSPVVYFHLNKDRE